MRRQKEIDLTNGEILPNLVRFMLPVLAGQLFQTLYNSVDSVVVGNFVGTNALAAVTASSSITMFFVGFFTGLATGASVVFAMHFGAKEYENLSNDIHTAMTFSIALGILVAAAGILFAPQLLSLVSCPSDVYGDALIYLRIYMVGILFMSLYNVGAAVLRSVGDSQSPFYYLLTSSCMNIVLDVLFVAIMGLGVAGVAIATVISQFTSVCLTFRKMMGMNPAYRFSFRQMHIDFQILKKIIALGLPAGIQSSITSLSNIYLQHYINQFSAAAIAGIGSAMKIDQFAGMPCNAMGLAMTTYIGQNLGAQKPDRARKGVRIATVAMAVCVSAVGIPIFFFAKQLMSIFGNDEAMIQYGVGMLHTIMSVYLIMGFQMLYGGIIRGYGYSRETMFMAIGGMVVVRQIWLAVSLGMNFQISNIYLCYPIGWAATAVPMLLFYLFVICKKYNSRE